MDEDEIHVSRSPSNPNDMEVLQQYHAVRVLLLYILNQFDHLEMHRTKFTKNKQSKSTIFYRGITLAIYALNGCSLARKLSYQEGKQKERRVAIKLAKKYVEKLGFYLKQGQASPDIALLVKLVQAELATLQKNSNSDTSLSLYSSVIKGFTINKMWVFRAVAYERASEFLFSVGRDKTGVEYLNKAWKAYGDYGATAKMDSMQEAYLDVYRFPCDSSDYVCSPLVLQSKCDPIMQK